MDDRHFPPAAEVRELEGVLDEPEGLFFCSDLERLHDPGVDFVLDSCELPFCVLSNHSNIYLLVPGFYARVGKTQVHVREKIQVFVEFVIIVVFCLDSFLRDHDSQQDTLIFLQCLSLHQVFEGEVSNEVKVDWHVRRLEYFNHASYLTANRYL